MTPARRPTGPVIVGIDVGTTGVKAVTFDLASSWRHVAVREYPLLQPAPGWQVQDPDTMVAAATSAVADCVAVSAGTHVVAIAASSAMHGLLALDRDLRPLTPLVTWADARAAEQARSLRTSGQATRLHRLTGTPVHPMTPLTKLRWFRRHQPAIWASARWWVGLKDYLLYRLTGTLVTELSSASGTGLLDLATRSWNPEVIELSGVSLEQLPPILSTTATLGLSPAAADRIGLPLGTPVVVGAGDGPLGNLGTGAITPGVVGLSLGTSGAARMVVSQPQVDERGALFCYALTESAWVLGGAVSNGGIVIRWAGQSLAPDVPPGAGGTGDEALLDLAAGVGPGSNGLVMLPYLLPERAPLWDPDLPGAYLGLRHRHTRAHLIRAAVEGVCRQLAVIVDDLDRLEPVTSVRATGGAFRSPLWRDIMAATLNRPLHVVGAAEGSALGAAALGLLALGRANQLTDAVELLTHPDDSSSTRIRADAALVATYARLRAAIPDLIASLQVVPPLFADEKEILMPDTIPAPASSPRPVVTLFESYGSGADYVGPRVARALGVPFHPQAFSTEEIEDAAAQRESEGTLSRLFSTMRGSYAYAGLDGASVPTAQRDNYELVLENTRKVQEQASVGGVIMGRNGALILANRPATLHVKLDGPLQQRIERAAKDSGIDIERAAKRQKREDQVRADISIEFYQWDPRETDRYDLVVNTGTMDLDTCVAIIVQAARIKAGLASATAWSQRP